MSSLENQYLRMVEQAARGAAPCLVRSRARTAPRDTGKLADSIGATVNRVGRRIRVTVEQDAGEAPHGQIINNPKAPGGRIFSARPGGSLRFETGGQTIFAKSVKQSTEHKGWWDDFEWVAQLEECMTRQLR